ncbi:hypothetical protein LJR084_001862 [Variovorax sp. LjRoot84]|uniref:hypothetical protein n=1 Tax=Variovorax sp. LjRoot84 TaxID=3342340 RepID=UPI003ECF04DA
MAQIPMVTAVRFNKHGDVSHVLMGTADNDTPQPRWVHEPVETPVLDLVDKLMADDLVETRMANGTSGPKLRVVEGKAGGGIETVVTDDPKRPIEDFPRF